MPLPVNTLPVPNTDFLGVPIDQRIVRTQYLKIGPVYVALQRTLGGSASWLTISEAREIVYATTHPSLTGCLFYRSFAGTGGKAQFQWYPIGGVYSGISAATQTGLASMWIIKGSPKTDPFYGRIALGRLMDSVNAVFPHMDTDVSRFMSILGVPDQGWATSVNYETIPTVIDTKTALLQQSKLSDVLQLWKDKGLTPTFGQRGQDYNARNPEAANVTVNILTEF